MYEPQYDSGGADEGCRGLLRQTVETIGGFKELVNAFLSLDQTRNSLLISTVSLSCGLKGQTGSEEEVTTDSIYKQ